MKQIHADKTMAGYEYLLAYKVTVPIYDLTMEFVKTYIPYKSRTTDQMEQAARSGMQNIPEGYKQQSLAGYIKLSGVSRGSLEELLKDYLSYARQQKLEVWDKERAKREIREIGEIWEIIKKYPYLPAQPNFPSLPNDPTKAVNLLLTLIQQANFLIDKLIFSLKEKHTREGGFRENLFKKRLAFLGSKKFQQGFIKITKRSLAVYLMTMLVVTGSGLIYLFNPFVSKTQAAWYDDNWMYRTPIVITHNAALTNQVVKFDIDTSTATGIGNKIQSDCDDSRFTDASGNLLLYFLDSTNGACGTNSTDYYVKIPTINNGATIIYHYYGNSSATAGTQASNFPDTPLTPSSSYASGTEEKGPGPVGYWKFDEGVDGTCSGGTNDACNSGSGGNALDGAESNMTIPSATSGWQTENQCISGKCLRFDKTDDVINTGSNVAVDDLGAITLEAWIEPISQGENSAGVILAKNVGTTPSAGWLFQFAGTNALTFTVDGSTDLVRTTANSVITLNRWNHVIVTWDGVITTASSVHIYVNGVEVSYATTTNGASRVSDATSTLYIGNDSTGADTFDGTIDDIKVYNFVRTAAQIQTDFNSRGTGKGTGVALGGNAQNLSGTLSNGLVGYWKMEETATPSLDSSGNGNSGTWNANTASTTGKFGNGTTFDGTDDYIEAADSTSLDVTTLTLSAWINATALGGTIIQKSTSAGTDGYSMDTTSSKIRFCAAGGCASSTTTLSTATWQHIAVTFDGTTTRFYLNGVLDGTSTTVTSVPTNALVLRMGVDSTSATDYNGKIDEARVYNRALSAAEVLSLYNFAPGPLRYFKFDENTGLTVNDASGNGGTATAGDMSWTSGKYGSAGNFDGTDDYVGAGSNTDIDNIPSGGGLTVGLWFNWMSIAANKMLITKDNNGTAGWKLQMTNSGNGTVLFTADLATTDISISVDVAPGSAISSEWHHVAVTFDNGSVLSTPTAVAYFDGRVVQTVTGSGAYQSDAARDLEIGRQNASVGSQQWNGKMDDVRIYNYARSAKQVVEDMNAGHPAPGSNASPVGYWKMDQGTGTTARDSSGLSNGLTLSTASWTNAGKFDKAWNGTGGAIRMSRATDADLEFAAADDLTISLWQKSDASGGTNPAATEYLVDDTTAQTDVGFSIYANTDGTICFGIDDDATWGPDDSVCTTADIYDNTWHHIVATKTGTSRIDLYVDGQSTASDTSLAATGTLDGNNTFFVGDIDTDDAASGEEFAGDIDELKLFRAALTSEEVKQDYNRASSLVLGALSDTTSGNQAQSAAAEYCVPGDSTSCAGPVGQWRFDENTGTTANDTSTNGNEGTLAGSPGWVPGKFGPAIAFNGDDEIVNMAAPTELDNIFDAGGAFTAWIKPYSDGESDQGTIFAKRAGGADGLRFFTSNEASSKVKLTFREAFSGTHGVWTTTNTVVDVNKWAYLAVVYNNSATTNDPTIYVNGVSVAVTEDTTPVGTDSDDDASHFDIGAYGTTTSNAGSFDGAIDMPRVYKYAFTASQVAWDYNHGGPVAHWKMDECQGTTINDSSGNSLTGTLTPGGAPISSAGDCTTSATTSWYGGRNGKLNSDIDFDGTDDYISVADTAALRFDASTQDFSLFAWVKRDTTGTEYIMSKEDADNDGWRLLFSSNNVVCSEDATDVTSSSTITDTNWHFVGCTIDRDGNGQVYIDGKADGSTAAMGTDAMATTSNITIGTRSYSSTSYLNGQIDDVKIFNYALTAVQVRTLYNGGAVRFAPVTGTP